MLKLIIRIVIVLCISFVQGSLWPLILPQPYAMIVGAVVGFILGWIFIAPYILSDL